MADIYWDSRINDRVLRDGTSWNQVQGFISDKTRSGKPKRRFANSMEKKPFDVKFRFSFDEFELFNDWYENTLFFGTLPFFFKKINSVSKPWQKYQIADGGAPSFNNVSGKLIECTMKWEEV